MISEATLTPERAATSRGVPDCPTGMPIRHSVHHDFDELSSNREAWDDLVQATGDDLFASYDWCRIWWKHYEFNRRLQIHLFHCGDELVGVFPLFEERLRLGPFALNAVRLVGCDHSVTTCGFACLPEHLNTAVHHIVQHLQKNIRWDALHFGPLAGYSEYREKLATSLRERKEVRHVEDGADDGPHIIFPLPENFDAYVESLPGGERSNLRRREKKLQELNPKAQLAHVDEVDSHLRTFMEQHREQWHREGKLGHFGDWPRSVEFHLEMAHTLDSLGRLQLLRIDTGHGCVGYQYNYLFGRRIYWILGSRSADTRWDTLSPGQRLHCVTLRLAFEAGRTEIDAMKGMYEYKIRLGGVVKHLQSVTAISRRMGSALRLKCFRIAARAVHILYYRLWFCRFAAYFPRLQRPLWTLWIRSRL
ncbi:MAG: GNAT family N-acetyltransferase [Planctomycetes bacterium]|nr:GNAT family N-acetyltransferase [Planctomycetota bacterium]MBI3833267.1 GNAT family N-acetyltransferase [Planctomycetota bacterium]